MLISSPDDPVLEVALVSCFTGESGDTTDSWSGAGSLDLEGDASLVAFVVALWPELRSRLRILSCDRVR